MAYCTHCGTKLLEDANYCTKCGAPVPGRKKKSRKLAPIVVAVALAAGLFVVPPVLEKIGLNIDWPETGFTIDWQKIGLPIDMQKIGHPIDLLKKIFNPNGTEASEISAGETGPDETDANEILFTVTGDYWDHPEPVGIKRSAILEDGTFDVPCFAMATQRQTIMRGDSPENLVPEIDLFCEKELTINPQDCMVLFESRVDETGIVWYRIGFNDLWIADDGTKLALPEGEEPEAMVQYFTVDHRTDDFFYYPLCRRIAISGESSYWAYYRGGDGGDLFFFLKYDLSGTHTVKEYDWNLGEILNSYGMLENNGELFQFDGIHILNSSGWVNFFAYYDIVLDLPEKSVEVLYRQYGGCLSPKFVFDPSDADFAEFGMTRSLSANDLFLAAQNMRDRKVENVTIATGKEGNVFPVPSFVMTTHTAPSGDADKNGMVYTDSIVCLYDHFSSDGLEWYNISPVPESPWWIADDGTWLTPLDDNDAAFLRSILRDDPECFIYNGVSCVPKIGIGPAYSTWCLPTFTSYLLYGSDQYGITNNENEFEYIPIFAAYIDNNCKCVRYQSASTSDPYNTCPKNGYDDIRNWTIVTDEESTTYRVYIKNYKLDLYEVVSGTPRDYSVLNAGSSNQTGTVHVENAKFQVLPIDREMGYLTVPVYFKSAENGVLEFEYLDGAESVVALQWGDKNDDYNELCVQGLKEGVANIRVRFYSKDETTLMDVEELTFYTFEGSLYASDTNLTISNKLSKTIRVFASSLNLPDVVGSYYFEYIIDDEEIVNCTWNSKPDDYSCTLIITGKKPGKTRVTVRMLDNHENCLLDTTIDVTVE